MEMARFIVNYTFHGRATRDINAASLDEAKDMVGREIESDYLDIDADSIDDVDFTISEMHPVTRDGREIWTTYVLKTDVRGHQSAMETASLFSGVMVSE
jgi:hypothetical protein